MTCGDRLLEMAAFAAGGAEHRLDADLRQQGNEPHDQVLFAVNHGPLAEDVLMAIDIGVDEAAPLQGVLWRRGLSGHFLQHLKETVASRRPMGIPRAYRGTPKRLSSKLPSRFLAEQGAAELQGGPGAAHGLDVRHRRAPGRNLFIVQSAPGHPGSRRDPAG